MENIYVLSPHSLYIVQTLFSLILLVTFLHLSPNYRSFIAHAAQSLSFPLPFFPSSLYWSIPKLKILGFVGWFKFGFHLEFLGFLVERAFGCFWVCGFSLAGLLMVAVGVFFFFFFSSSLYCSIPKLKIQGFVGWFKFGFHLEFLGFSM